MTRSTPASFVVTHSLDPEDAVVTAAMRAMVRVFTPFLVRVSCEFSGRIQLLRKGSWRQVAERRMRPMTSTKQTAGSRPLNVVLSKIVSSIAMRLWPPWAWVRALKFRFINGSLEHKLRSKEPRLWSSDVCYSVFSFRSGSSAFEAAETEQPLPAAIAAPIGLPINAPGCHPLLSCSMTAY